MEPQIVLDPQMVAQANEVTTQNSEDLDPKFLQRSEVDRPSHQAQSSLDQRSKAIDGCRKAAAKEDGRDKGRALSSRDFVITNTVEHVDARHRFSIQNRVAPNEGSLDEERTGQQSAEEEERAGQKESRETGISAETSEQKIELSGLTSSAPLTDLDLTAQSRLLQSQNTQKAQSSI